MTLRRLAAGALALLLWPGTTHALQTPTTRPELCAMADVVVVAEVTTVETRWTAGPEGGIETRVWVAVDRVVRGAAGQTLEIAVPGGQMGELTLHVEDAAELRSDRRYLLLLEQREPELYGVVGGATGAIAVQHATGGPGEPADQAISSLGGCRAEE